MSNIKKEKHFLDGLIDTYHSSIDIKQELQVQPRPDVYKGHFINALTLASTHFMDMQPNARELWPQSHSSGQEGGKIFLNSNNGIIIVGCLVSRFYYK